MRKRLLALVCMALTGLLIWRMPGMLRQYPVNRDGAIRQKAWQGVVRVWVCQDWSASAMAWITRQAAEYEKAHKGIRVSIRRVPKGAWLADGAVLPDVLVFSPGMVDEPDGLLAEFGTAVEFMPEASRAGRWRDKQYALPLALGGYAVLINNELWPAGAPLAEPDPIKKQDRYALHAPSGGALAALAGWQDGLVACRSLSRPQGFGEVTAEAAYGLFASGNVAALVCSVDQVRRFGALAAAGRGFEYRVETPLLGFNDQVLMLGRVVSDGDKRRDAAVEAFVWWTTGKAAQDTLAKSGLISARMDAAAAGESMPTLTALRERYTGAPASLLIPNAYGWTVVKDEFGKRALHAVLNDAASFPHAIEQVR